MKYFKRLKLYKANNVTFSPETMDAYSYRWWRFVAKVDGLVIFNNCRYSPSTGNHQRKIARVLNELGIKIDLVLNLPDGIQDGLTLEEHFVLAEEALCDLFLLEESRRIRRNERAQVRRKERKQQAPTMVTQSPPMRTLYLVAGGAK